MKPVEEKLYLVHILKDLDSKPSGFITSKWLPWAGWLIWFCYFILLFQFYRELGHIAFAGLSILAGFAAGVAALWRICASKWEYVRPHLDRTSIERRVSEIQS